MNFKINIDTTEAYYEEAYLEIVSLSKYKKYEPIFAIILIIIGLLLFLFDKKNILGYFSLLLCLFGIFEFYKSISEKKRWIKARLKSEILNKNILLEFTQTNIIHNGPFSKGEINWNGINKIIKTKKGIILKPQNGISIYLPDSKFESQEQINFILSKNKNSI